MVRRMNRPLCVDDGLFCIPEVGAKRPTPSDWRIMNLYARGHADAAAAIPFQLDPEEDQFGSQRAGLGSRDRSPACLSLTPMAANDDNRKRH